MPRPRPRPAERINAAIKIQRTYRAYRAVRIAVEEISELEKLVSLSREKYIASKTPSSRKSGCLSRSAQLNNAIALREHADTLSMVKLTFADIMRGGSALSEPRVRAACAQLAKNITAASEDLERAKADLWIQELQASRSRRSTTLGAILESDSESDESSSGSDPDESDALEENVKRTSVVRTTLRRKPRVVLSRPPSRLGKPVSRSPNPSLHSILEED